MLQRINANSEHVEFEKFYKENTYLRILDRACGRCACNLSSQERARKGSCNCFNVRAHPTVALIGLIGYQ
ncbi:hypothetical protein T07_7698 [Trichinella nelsoni]|uniref:Uncharacterized protein n=1 Tax=Trichinella nelsoni TaxID=6336 RepID=A0A0V0S5U7_9BILA|nr:hypothetical protein T07_7698 [Trichinella nelsoni]